MTDFNGWCTPGTLVPIGDHRAGVLESYDDAKGSAMLAASLPNAYAASDSLAMIAELGVVSAVPDGAGGG